MTQSQTLSYRSKPPRPPLRTASLWRAMSYLRPYRRLVIISIIAAFMAGGVLAGGLTAILPVLQTLLAGDTPQTWADRMVAEERWGIDLADDPTQLRVIDGWPRLISSLQPAAATDLPVDQRLRLLAEGDETAVASVFGTSPAVSPQPVPWHLQALRRLVYLLPASPVGAIAVLMIGLVLLALVGNSIRFVQEYLSGKAAFSAVNDVRRDLYDHTLRMPMSYFGRTGASDVTSRIVHDSGQLQFGFTTVLGPAVQQPILAFFAFLVAMVIDWRLTLFIVAFGPLMALVLRRFGRKMRRASNETLINNAELLGQIESTLSGIRVVKAYGAEDYESSRLSRVLARLLRYQVKLQKYDAASSPVMETLNVAVVAIIVVVMVYFVREQQTLSAAGAVLIFACLAQMADSLRRLSKLNVILQKSNAAAERIFAAMDMEVEEGGGGRHEGTEARRHAGPEVDEPALRGPPPSGRGWPEEPGEGGTLKTPIGAPALRASVPPCLRAFSRDIAFEHVTFRYNPDLPPAIEDVSLTVHKGESLAVVGRNGSGKTTLLSLLPRFFEPESGRILIDGIDVRDVALQSLRSQIGVVTQEAIVFPGTIAENIAYALPDASQEAIESAARQAEAHEFILAKPQGYDTLLTGLGGQLSGGQRQRLNIARAILRDPPILILDEATSQVDAESEHLIQQAIRRLMQGRTVFVIAHRFSTILDCDRIALMEAGRLAAVGTHGQLLETNELYRQLYDRQLVGV